MSSDNYTILRMTWLDQVMRDKDVQKTLATTVAYFIAKYFNRQRFVEKGVLNAWPSYATLVEDTGCSERSVRRAVKLLRDHGHIETRYHGGGHFSLQYRAVLIPPDGHAEVGSSSSSEVDSVPASARAVIGDHPSHTRKYSCGPFRVVKAGHPSDADDHSRVVTDGHQISLNKSLNEIFEDGAQAKEGNKPQPSVNGDGPIGLRKLEHRQPPSAPNLSPSTSSMSVKGISHGKAARAAAERRLGMSLNALDEQAMAQVLEWFTPARHESALDAELARRGGGMAYIREAMGEERLASFQVMSGDFEA